METRANYVTVGIFTLVAILSAFAFVYWTAAVGERGETAQVRILIPGSASGLGRGSAILFNGVRVGDIRRVYIDPRNPAAAIADAEIDRLTPITRSTQVDVGLAGLTGQANIELRGANLDEPSLLDEADANNTVAELTANPSAVTNLLESAQSIFRRADSVLTEFEGFATDVRGPLVESARNAQRFSEALGRNAEGIDTFLASVSELSGTLARVSGQLESTLGAAETFIAAIDPDRINAVVSNVEEFTGDLRVAGDGLANIMANVDRASESVAELTASAQGTFARVDGAVANVEAIIGEVDPQVIGEVVANFSAASDTIRQAAADVSSVAETVSGRSDDIDAIISDARLLGERLNQASLRVDSVLVRVDDLLGSGQADGVIADTRDTLRSFRQVADTLNERIDSLLGSEETEGLIADARQTLDAFRGMANTIDARVDDVLGSENTQGLIADASATLAAYRQVANTLNQQVGVISGNLSRFTGQGLREVDGLVRDTRQSINRIERAITDLERNPQRILGGGAGEVRQFDGRQRR